ncbi:MULTISPECIES: type VI secretion system protein TssL, long form [Lelliottia]|uniref:Type VI secretion system protein TssL, long form n=1 Tax=Lelliottia wanjuensis TaxID=3050585 RepID=A0AAP4D1G6_9ENTR|nr:MULTISPECIES: type VI secretion system protein TssL, long form [unclassified Lelliottia]MDK9361817.1 type VI secretion system protein TssL, long form [Lelliottia sp. V106_12]MDK9582969.1 type VI secretion system protein TssL, long form [Lelliottia sp. V86_10]MDK9618572.1 type VI secretion system protein TssL, long form [Lelliottia sp. V106_9]
MSDNFATLGQDNEQSLQALGMFLLDEHSDPEPERSTRAPLPEGEPAQLKALTAFNEADLKGESIQQRVMRVNASGKPLLEACQPLLRALSEMPTFVADVAQVEVLKRTLSSEINVFTVICEEVNIPWKKMTIARYCLCTALDESAHASPWGISAGWARSNLLNHFEGDNDGGNKFFLLAGRLSMHPHEYDDVLDIMLRILALGFEGRYSIIEDGDRQLMKIRQRLQALLQNTQDKIAPELSPNGLPKREAVRQKWRIHVPIRATLLLAGLLTTSTFFWCKYHLLVQQHALTSRMAAITRLELTHPVVKGRLRLAVLLKDEIDKKLLSVDENDKQSKVIFNGDSMFTSGSIDIRPDRVATLNRVATEIRRVNGEVLIVGHTDATPIHKPGIEDNHVLSEKRAASVAELLIKAGVPRSNIRIQGAGETQPLQSNQDPTGRARNRRVEMFVTY